VLTPDDINRVGDEIGVSHEVILEYITLLSATAAGVGEIDILSLVGPPMAGGLSTFSISSAPKRQTGNV